MAASTTMTYAILTASKETEGSVKFWANHALIPAAQCLQEGEAWVVERLRVREMQTKGDLTFASGTSVKTVPDGFLQPMRLSIDGYGKLKYLREEDFPDVRESDGDLPSGHPSYWTVVGDEITFDTELDEELTGRFWYFGTPARLATGNQTNFLTDKYPSLFRHAILARAYASRNRADLMAVEETLAAKLIAEANVLNDTYRFGQDL